MQEGTTYQTGMTVEDYVEKAGGYGQFAETT